MQKQGMQKKGVLVVAIMLMFALIFAGVFVASLHGSSTWNAEAADEPVFGEEGEIQFTLGVQGDKTRYIDVPNYAGETVIVDYKITTNSGFNSILLVPDYDDIFTITDIAVSSYDNPDVQGDELGSPTITGTEDEDYDGNIKIALDKSGEKYTHVDGENEVFLTITYSLTGGLQAGSYGGNHVFGLKLEYVQNDSSIAFKYLDGTSVGLQERVRITVATDTLTLVEKQNATITIGSNNTVDKNQYYDVNYVYYFGYRKAPVDVKKVAELTPTYSADNYYVEYTYNGDATPIIKWYQAQFTDYGSGYVYEPGAELELGLESAPKYAGDYVIGISAPATDAYYEVDEVYAYVHIHPLLVEINVADKESAYGAPLAELTYTVNMEPYTNDSWTITLATAAYNNGANAGSYPISANITNVNGSYEFEIHEGTYVITKKSVTLTALPQSATYTGSEPTVDQSKYTLEGVSATGLVIVITKGPGVEAGNYTLTPSINLSENNYEVTITSGTFTINKKAITVTALSQSAAYSGSEPTVDQTKYTVTVDDVTYQYNEYTVIGGVTINKDAGVNVGSYALTPGVNNDNYNVTLVNGTFTITSVNLGDDYFKGFFEGKSLPYNGASQDLLTIKSGIDNWWSNSYSIADNVQTNVNTTNDGKYIISITIELSNTDAANYNNGNAVIAFTVEGEITPVSVELTAVDHGHTYGDDPEELSYTVTSGSFYDDDKVSYTVKDNQANTVALSSSTNAGTYTIEINVSNSYNYNITLHNGTYTVSKAANSITLTANDVYYNRPLSVSASATAGTPVIKYYSDSGCTNEVTPENAGTYYVKATVGVIDNYNAAYAVDSFVINKIKLATPTLSYDGDKVTLSEVTTDKDGVALTSGTLTYTVNGTELGSNRTYTATTAAPSGFTYTVSSDNNNYLSCSDNTAAVYSATFDKGGVSEWSNYPSTIYVFDGQSFTIPDEAPTSAGKNFSVWKIGETTYNKGITINDVGANYAFVAQWNLVTYTMTVVYVKKGDYSTTSRTFTATDGEEVAISTYNLKLQTGLTGDNDEMAAEYDYNGIRYTFGNLWSYKITGTEDYIEEGIHQVPLTVDNNYTFVAVYAGTPIDYTFQYMLSIDGGAYAAYGEETEIAFGATITYATLTNRKWFAVDAWYTDAERTELAPETMPAGNLTVYGAYNFDIGAGDVNGNGYVTTDDITLYRKWIVGGYTMTVVESGEEWTTATAANFDPNGVYFLKRVATVDEDDLRDIRDVSTIRMALVGGYAWDIVTEENVTGAEVVRSKTVNTYSELTEWFGNNNERVSLNAPITAENSDLAINSEKNIFIDLCGNALTVKSLTLTTSGNGATITIKNGTIVTTNGVTLSAPNGNVTISNVTAYDANGIIKLQAASNSLHFFGLVAFYERTIQVENNAPVLPAKNENLTPAPVKVESGTRIVIEEAAEVVVEKVVATVSFVQSAVAEIVIKNDSAVTEAIEIVGNYVEEESTVENKVVTKVSDYAGLVAANGKTVTLGDNIVCSSDIIYTEDTTINLNGHTITFSGWGLEINNNTLTINGEKQGSGISAVEATLYAQKAGHLVINGGTYTSTDNMVIGTNGTEGRGGNTITINGGTFNGGITTAGNVACGIYVANDDIVVVNGGTFNITNGVGILARSGNTTVNEDAIFNVTGNGTLGKVGDSNVTVPSGAVIVYDLAANYPGDEPALVNNTEYDVVAVVETIADINAVKASVAEIVLSKDITYSGQIGFATETILNLNGKTLRSTNNVAISVGGENGNLTIKGNGNVIAQEACVMAFNGAAFTIDGGTYTAIDNFVFGTNGTSGQGGNTITINNGTFNGGIVSNGYVACGIYVANNDTVVVNGGTFNITNGVGILARSGNTTVSENVVINNLGDNEISGKVGDANKPAIESGNKIVVDYVAGYPGGAPTLTNNTSYDVYTINAQ